MPGHYLAVENGNLVVKVGVNILFLISQRDVGKLVGRNLSPSDRHNHVKRDIPTLTNLPDISISHLS